MIAVVFSLTGIVLAPVANHGIAEEVPSADSVRRHGGSGSFQG